VQAGGEQSNSGVTMANPVLVEVMRGDVVESRHRGSVAVCDGDGAPVLSIGDVERPVRDRDDQVVLVPEVAVDGPGGEPGGPDHIGHGRLVETLGGHAPHGGEQDLFAALGPPFVADLRHGDHCKDFRWRKTNLRS
jgi:hypothetical protein